MTLGKTFEPRAIEAKWYPYWEGHGLFKPSLRPGVESFCIQLPPPNITGTLHMGHAFQQTLMDKLDALAQALGRRIDRKPATQELAALAR